MSDYIIAASSTTDLTQEYAKEHNLTLLPFSFMIDGKVYADDFGKSMSLADFYSTIRGGASASTSLVNAGVYEKFFSEMLEKKLDILYIELSSALTGSVDNAISVAEKLNAKYENKVYIVDSLSASRGFGLLIHYALKMQKEGKSAEEVHQWIEKNKLNFIHWFTVDDLNHLKRGGRVSAASAFVGTMLKIKPVLNVDNQGRLIPRFKIRGRKKSLQTMVEQMKSDILNPDGQTVFIGHADCPEDAQYVESLIRNEFPTITDIQIAPIGPVIGAHSGPGTIALFYVGSKRYEES